MKKIKLLFCLSTIFLLAGCYNYRELNDLAITTALGIDKTEDGYRITAQIVNTQKSSSDSNDSTSPKIIIYTGEGKTIQEAIRKMILESPKRLYPYHMEILMFSEEVAKEGIKDSLDIFFRDSELRKQIYVLIARNTTAENILKTLTPIDTLVSSNLLKSLKADNMYLGMSELINFEEIMDDYLNEKTEITMPSVILQGSSEEGEKKENLEESKSDTSILLDEIAIFKEDKLVGYLNKDKSIFFNILNNNVNDTIVSYKCDDHNYISIEIIDFKTEIKPDNDKFKITIKIAGKGNINEINCQLDIENDQVIKELSNKLNDNIEQEILDVINISRNDYSSDFLGFKDYFYRDSQKMYKKIGENWYNDIFKNLEIDIESDISLIEKGNIVKVIHEQQ